MKVLLKTDKNALILVKPTFVEYGTFFKCLKISTSGSSEYGKTYSINMNLEEANRIINQMYDEDKIDLTRYTCS